MLTLEELMNARLREQVSLLWDALNFRADARHALIVFDEAGQIVDIVSLPFNVSIMTLKQVFCRQIRECVMSHEKPSSLVLASMTNIDLFTDPAEYWKQAVTAIREDFQKLTEERNAGFIALGATD